MSCYVVCCTVQQVAFADKILLNKTDLVSDADKAYVIKRIRVGLCNRTNCSVCLYSVVAMLVLKGVLHAQRLASN